MPFESKTVMKQKIEFCLLAIQSGSNLSDLCKRFNISRRIGYKWLNRFAIDGLDGLKEKSRRPGFSPGKLATDIEDYIISIRKENPEWGSKKVQRILINKRKEAAYPFKKIPCRNTITRVFERNGLISEERKQSFHHWQTFEFDSPNILWQMDFKGFFLLLNNTNCYPLTILDDHSRFNIGLYACGNEREMTVKNHLISSFRKYGMPSMILSDNGPPWGTAGMDTQDHIPSYSRLEKWLIRLQIKPIHGRPYHPQTQGKEERFHRTLKTELLNYEKFDNLQQCQDRFDKWREKYNCVRPHEAIDLEVPVSRYKPSKILYPEVLPPVEYNDSDMVCKVGDKGWISFQHKKFHVGRSFCGDFVAIKPTSIDGKFEIYYCNQKLRDIYLH